MIPDLETRLERHAAQMETVAPRIELSEVRSLAASASGKDVRVPIFLGKRRTVFVLVVLAVVVVAAAVTYALRSEMVEEGPLLGKFMEIDVAPDGLPFIVYTDDVTGGTIFAKCADRFCAEGTTFTHFDGFFPTVLMRDDSRPLIWIDGPDGVDVGPWLLDCEDAACSVYAVTELDSMPTEISDIAESGRILMTFWNQAGDLVIGTCENPACQVGITETVVTDAAYVNVIRAFFDASDRPVLIFVHGSELHLVRCRAPDCSTGYDRNAVATGDFDQGTPANLAIGSDGIPWIAHGRYGSQIARCSDEVCTSSETVPLGTDENALVLSALVGSDDLPLFVYNWSESDDTMVLKVARCSDVSCMKGTVATVHRGSFVSSPTGTLGDDGKPIIAFRSGDGVLAITCGDAACTDGALDVARWNHTDPPLPTAVPDRDSPPTSAVSQPPGDPASGPLFDPGMWVRVSGFDTMFGCEWGATDDRSSRACQPDGSSGLGLSGDVHLVSMVNLDGTLVVVTQACQTAPSMQANEPELASECVAGFATAWTSTDGRNWAPSLIAEAGWVEWLVTSGSGLVAVGESCDEEGTCLPAVWTSPDGSSWLPTPTGTLPDCTGLQITFQCITGVVGGAGHYLMHGHDATGTALWLSSDGVDWQPIDMNLADDYAAFGEVAWIIEGRLIGLVNVCGPLADDELQRLVSDEVRDQSTYFWDLSVYGEHWASCSRSLWTSDDGSKWSGSDATETFGLMSYFGGFSWEGGALVTGATCQDRYTCKDRAWASVDGITWDAHSLEGPRAFPGGPMVATDDGLVSAGIVFDQYETGEDLRFVWTSENGLEWTATEFQADRFPNGILVMAPYGRGIVIIDDGRGYTFRPDLAGVWTWAPSD
jgi:hypothetical protein